jgi:hypothetical protein
MTNPTKPASGGPKRNQPGKSTGGSKIDLGKPGTAQNAAGKAKAAPNRAQSKKIVNQRQTPWGLIIATVLIVALAVGVIGYAVSQNKKKSDAANPDKISGIVHKDFPSGEHKTTAISYAESPPIGGPHSPVWADCDGTVYPSQIANENAVHDLEHGAVWITYKPGLDAAQVSKLSDRVKGKDYMLMSPFTGLDSNVSLQAWGFQLKVETADDPRIDAFIKAARVNASMETGAICSSGSTATGDVPPAAGS